MQEHECSIALKYIKLDFDVKTSRFSLILRNVIMDIITFTENLSTTSGLSILLHGIISQTRRYVINCINLKPSKRQSYQKSSAFLYAKML